MKKWEIKSLGYYSVLAEKLVIKSELKAQFDAECKLLAKDVCRITIVPYDEKKEVEEQRSLAQNRYYHKLLDIICDHTGDEHMDMHKELKVRLLSNPYVLDDREYIIVGSTRDLTTKEFGGYLEKVFKFASEEFSLVLPSSNQYY